MQDCDAQLESISSLSMPKNSELIRDFTRPAERRTPDFEARFDRHTIIYDAWHDQNRGLVYLLCPRTINFWPHIKRGLTIDGRPARIRRKIYKRFEVLSVKVPDANPNPVLHIKMGPIDSDIPLSLDGLDVFRGMNVLCTVSKNNDLEWIRDWVRFHRNAHNAEAVLVIDNGSDRYGIQEILDTITSVEGIHTARVLSAPFPYGPMKGGTKKLEIPAAFLQASMLNLMRLRFLQEARAVLFLDVDEILRNPNGVSVFDAVCETRLGVTAFYGHWAYAPNTGFEGAAQKKHTHVGVNGPERCNSKWAVRPNSFIGKGRWGIHRMMDAIFPLCFDDRFSFWHCRHSSTFWNPKKTADFDQARLKPNADLRSDWDNYLP